ncbi:MAG: hypothetical protein QG559_1643, partial [Campylobacterota bacterium]|nr:hypothetical protein [Campylobacterota bacterium]
IKTLSNAIAAFYQKQITEPEINDIIAAMKKKGFIEVNDSKVSYNT